MKENGENILKALTALTGQKSFVVGPRLTARKRANLRTPNLNLKAGRPGRTVKKANALAIMQRQSGAHSRRCNAQ